MVKGVDICNCILKYLDSLAVYGEENQYVVAALYQFADLHYYKEFREPLKTFLLEHDIKGSLLLASEGINGTVSGTRFNIDLLLKYLRTQKGLENLVHKESFKNEHAFHRTNVKLKKEIVTMGVDNVDPSKLVGTYVQPKDWNNLIKQKDVVLLDTRNDYEVQIGTFEGAIDPNTKTFREFPKFVEENLDPKKTPKVAMFCTGGIRCEKASSLLKMKGFQEVYHLRGGILKYLEEIDRQETTWQGECFVFDDRISVDHDLNNTSIYSMCYGCRRPLHFEEKNHTLFEEGVCCHRCHNERSEKHKIRSKTRKKNITIANKRGFKHGDFRDSSN